MVGELLNLQAQQNSILANAKKREGGHDASSDLTPQIKKRSWLGMFGRGCTKSNNPDLGFMNIHYTILLTHIIYEMMYTINLEFSPNGAREGCSPRGLHVVAGAPPLSGKKTRNENGVGGEKRLVGAMVKHLIKTIFF